MNEWISVNERLPDVGVPVKVLRDAGQVNNPKHPGYGNDGKWEEESSLLNPHIFLCDLASTGLVTHWKPLEI